MLGTDHFDSTGQTGPDFFFRFFCVRVIWLRNQALLQRCEKKVVLVSPSVVIHFCGSTKQFRLHLVRVEEEFTVRGSQADPRIWNLSIAAAFAILEICRSLCIRLSIFVSEHPKDVAVL